MKKSLALFFLLNSLSIFALAATPVADDALVDDTVDGKEMAPTHSAPSTSSEFNYKARAGKTLVNFEPLLENNRREYSSSRADYSVDYYQSAMVFGLERALGNEFSLGIHSSYGQETMQRSNQRFEQKYSGFSDVVVTGRYSPEDFEYLKLKLSVFMSPENAVNGTSTTNGNRFSGGHSVEPYISMENTFFGNLMAGAFVKYRIFGPRYEDTLMNNNVLIDTTTTTGGNTLATGGFGELHFNKFLLGTMMELSFRNSENVLAATDETVDDPLHMFHVGGYARFHTSENLDLVPSVTYSTIMNPERNGLVYTSYDNLNMTLTARIIL